MATSRGVNNSDDGLYEVKTNLTIIKDEDLIPKEIKSQELPKVPVTKNALFAVIFYWITSLSLVFLNKVIMVGDVTHMDAPLFMSWTQFLSTVIMCALLGKCGDYFSSLKIFPKFEYKPEIAKKVLPLTFVFLGMIIFNNLCLKYVEVSFYQVARSLTIVFNIIFSYLIINQTTKGITILCCVVIVVGYYLGCEGEVKYSKIGVIYGVASSIFVALNSIYVKKIMPLVDQSSEKLMLYNNMNSVLILPIIIMLFTNESEEISISSYAFGDPLFYTITIVAGIFGFLINFASYIQIKFTSPLSHNISGTAKAAVQTLIALRVYGNPVTARGMFGLLLVIVGSFAYSRLR